MVQDTNRNPDDKLQPEDYIIPDFKEKEKIQLEDNQNTNEAQDTSNDTNKSREDNKNQNYITRKR